MRQKLFTAVSLLSLLLCVATVAVWYVGYPRYPNDGPGRLGYFGVGNGDMMYSHWASRTRPQVGWRHCGISYEVFPVLESTFDAPPIGMLLVVSAPLWMVVATTLVLPLGWLISHTLRRLRRKSPNHCSNCHYNLTGNTSGVCPECGTVVAGRA